MKVNHTSAIDLWIDAKKLIFFCGSGISQFSPADLPTGSQLVSFVYQSLEKQLEKANCREKNLEELKTLPLETLIGHIIQDTTEPGVVSKLSDIASYFRKVSPNRLHYLISSFLLRRRNCHVITTNYDTGFEKALQGIKNIQKLNFDEDVEVLGSEGLNKIVFTNKNSIFKIHGCSTLDRPENLIVTTKQESANLPESFLKILPDLFENSLVVFLGYSLSEPDCLDALIDVSNYDVMWIDKSEQSFNGNFRAKLIVDRAKNRYYLEDLVPFIELSWKVVNQKLEKFLSEDLEKTTLRTPFQKNHTEQSNRSGKSFEDLVNVPNVEQLFRSITNAYTQLRLFEKAELFLNCYKDLGNYSEFQYYMMKAAIIRDKNMNWREACDFYRMASNLNSITSLEKARAESIKLGLESLIFQNDDSMLKQIETQLWDLIKLAGEQVKLCSENDRIEWISVKGRSLKNLIQNLSYRKLQSVKFLENVIGLCEEAVEDSKHGKDIQGRIETERFKARSLFRLYKITKDAKNLENAFNISERVFKFFLLLNVKMGQVNSKRQLALMLIESKRFDEAGKEISELKELVRVSEDKLSQIKTTGLESYLFFRERKIFRAIRNEILYLYESRNFSEAENQLKNIFNALIWQIRWRWEKQDND